MVFVYYTSAGIVLYVLSDAILNWLEARRGSLFPQRNLIFFVIITILSVTSFSIISAIIGE